MSAIYNNWERLVDAVLRREHDRQLCYEHSRTASTVSSSDLSFSSPPHDILSQLDLPGPAAAKSSSSHHRQHDGVLVVTIRRVLKEIVFRVDLSSVAPKKRFLRVVDADPKNLLFNAAASVPGVDIIKLDQQQGKLSVTGDMDLVALVKKLRKHCHSEILLVRPAREPDK